MYSEKTREALKRILEEIATPGTIWNRHLQMDDVIDIWRETNGCLIKYNESPTPFDGFYMALQRFKVDYPQGVETAVSSFISRLATRSETLSEDTGAPPGKKRVA